jgi:hypothetical protein
MSLSFQVSAGGSTVPVGMYKAIFVSVEETPPHAEFGKGCRFSFKVVGGEHDGEEASVICGMEKPASPKNRLGRILGGLVGKPVAPGETITLDQCVGKTFLIQVEQAPSGTGTRVGTVMPNFA